MREERKKFKSKVKHQIGREERRTKAEEKIRIKEWKINRQSRLKDQGEREGRKMNSRKRKSYTQKWDVREGVRIMLTVLTVLIVCAGILSGILQIYSPGKIEPYLDQNGKPIPGSVSEKVFVEICGIQQGMIIRSKNISNPVLLFVHGGPCFPEYFLIDKYNPGLEDYFTVCYWEQRGGGLSYSPNIPAESITMEQLASDTLAVTNYLRERFGQEKIYLMAHSGGTVFAIQAAASKPQLYYAYIGMAQITKQAESEKLAYQYMLNQYTAKEDTKRLEKLKSYPIMDSEANILPFYQSLIRDESMHELGIGTTRTMRSVLKDVFIPVMTCQAYTLKDKFYLWYSKFSFIKKTKLSHQLIAADITAEVPKLDVPVYFFSGRYDLTVNHELAKAYLDQLNAPVKGFYTFEESAHSPIFEEPEKMISILHHDVLAGTTLLADTL